MDPVILTVAFKGLGMLLVIVGGLLVARYGFRLYRDGAGSGRDGAAFEVGPIRLKAHSVGSVVMASACLWAWAGVVLSPNLDKKGEDISVYSFKTPQVSLKSLAVAASLPEASEKTKDNPEELKKLFVGALANPQANARKVVELDGKPAAYDLQSVRALKSETGQYLIATDVKTENKTATLAFEPRIESDKVLFVPADVGAGVDEETSPIIGNF